MAIKLYIYYTINDSAADCDNAGFPVSSHHINLAIANSQRQPVPMSDSGHRQESLYNDSRGLQQSAPIGPPTTASPHDKGGRQGSGADKGDPSNRLR